MVGAPGSDLLVEENVPFLADLESRDEAFLRATLGGTFLARRNDYLISRVVGHVVLPSGRTIRIRSMKAPAASIVAWAAYVDPLLRNLRVLGETPQGAADSDVAAVVARLFLGELSRVLGANGLSRLYQRAVTVSATIRGKIDFVGLARRAGDVSHVPCEIWERRPRTAVMRFLAAALVRINTDMVMREVDPPTLRILRAVFADVPPGVDPHLLAGRSQVPRNEEAFEAAVTIARLVLRRAGLSEGMEWTGLAYLVGLDLLFERAIVQALRESGLTIRPKHPLRHWRVAPDRRASLGEAPMELDVFCPTLAVTGVVIDAKYKDSISSANLQQVLAYCHLTGACQALLVVPEGGVRDLRAYRFEGRTGPVNVQVIEYDVRGRSVAAWREAGARFAACVARVGAAPDLESRSHVDASP